MRFNLCLGLLFALVALTAIFAAPLESRGSAPISLCDGTTWNSELKVSSGTYRRRLTKAGKGGLFRDTEDLTSSDNLFQRKFQWADGTKLKELMKGLSHKSIMEGDHIAEAQYIKDLIIRSILSSDGFKAFCQSTEEIRDKVFKRIKDKINSAENLQWCHKDANLSKLSLWGDLIKAKDAAKARGDSNPNLDDQLWGAAGKQKPALQSDPQRMVGISDYFQNTFNSVIGVSLSVFEIFEAEGDATIQGMRSGITKDDFLDLVYNDVKLLSTHLQDRAASVPSLNFQRWTTPTKPQVLTNLGRLCNAAGILSRRCLASMDDSGPDGIAWAAAAAAIAAAAGDSSSSSSQQPPSSTPNTLSTIQSAPSLSDSSSSPIPTSSSTLDSTVPPSSSSVPTSSSSSSQVSSSTPPPPPPPTTSSTAAAPPLSTSTPNLASLMAPFIALSIAAGMAGSSTPPPAVTPAPTSTVFPLGINTRPAWTGHLAGGGEVHEQ